MMRKSRGFARNPWCLSLFAKYLTQFYPQNLRPPTHLQPCRPHHLLSQINQRMLRQPRIPFLKQLLDPPNSLIPPDMPLNSQLLSLQILPIYRPHQKIQHLWPTTRHRVSRVCHVGATARTERPRYKLRGLVECDG